MKNKPVEGDGLAKASSVFSLEQIKERLAIVVQQSGRGFSHLDKSRAVADSVFPSYDAQNSWLEKKSVD